MLDLCKCLQGAHETVNPLKTVLLVQSCRCDNAGEDLVLDMLDISHAQNQEGMTTSETWLILYCVTLHCLQQMLVLPVPNLCTVCKPVLHINTGLSCMFSTIYSSLDHFANNQHLQCMSYSLCCSYCYQPQALDCYVLLCKVAKAHVVSCSNHSCIVPMRGRPWGAHS